MKILNKNIILEYLKANKEDFKNKYEVSQIGLFGSFVQGSETQDSDIDLVVDMKSSFKNYYALKNSLEEYFSRTIDLGMIGSIRSFIKKEIEKEIIYV